VAAREAQNRTTASLWDRMPFMEIKSMPYVHSLPTSVSFTGKGLLGYTFGPLSAKGLEVYYVEVEKGHDVFMVSKKITRIYYVLSGGGYFTINSQKYDVGPGRLVEIPPRTEYCYSGKMTLLAFSQPRWFSGNDRFTKWNPDVVGHDSPCADDSGSLLKRLVRLTICGKSPANAYLRLNQRLWDKLPATVTSLKPIRSYGNFVHGLARMQGVRAQAFSTCFLRNRPELELIRRLIAQIPKGDTLKVAVLGCSTGAEAYSIAWRIRSARPDVKLILHAADISRQAVEVAKCGKYSLSGPQLTSTQICDGMTAAEIEEIFHRDGDDLTVKSWIKEGISWHVGDAGDAEVADVLGRHDMVVANNFLCHMEEFEAERCLRNIARLVSPDGYLFVSGIDLDVRTKVACDLGWQPVRELFDEIHGGDPYLKRYWPSQYGGLEPLDKSRADWRVRYAAVFQPVSGATAPSSRHENKLGETRGRSERALAL
jgi:SAM-dependent methyltransferase/mannose-6-phosphate isomerase-like protein (cupin superfamily)